MGEIIKRLGAVEPSANVATTLYRVPAGRTAVVGCINVCNRNPSKVKVTVAHVDGAIANISNEDYIIYNKDLVATSTLTIQCGISMAASDCLYVKTNTASVNFIAWGSEMS